MPDATTESTVEESCVLHVKVCRVPVHPTGHDTCLDSVQSTKYIPCLQVFYSCESYIRKPELDCIIFRIYSKLIFNRIGGGWFRP